MIDHVEIAGYTLSIEVDQIEVTRDGTLPPYKPSTHREYIPGLRHGTLELSDGRKFDLTSDEIDEIERGGNEAVQRIANAKANEQSKP